MVKQLSSGPCVAMEIKSSQENCNVAVEFRKFVGPADPVSVTILLFQPNFKAAALPSTAFP